MRNLLMCCISSILLFSTSVPASVVMTGTRIIYSEQTKEKTIQLKNPDNQLYLVQLQVDDHENVSMDAPGSSSFVMAPQIFRMEPNAGQSVRLQYIGSDLPRDRESLFYFTFSQLPVLKRSEQAGNQLVLAITSKVKIFYRPKGLAGTSDSVAKSLTFKMNGKKIMVSNPTGYYAVVRKATLSVNGKEVKLADAVVVSPKSEVEWTPSSAVSTLSGSRLRLIIVNDYGVDVLNNIDL